MRFGLILLFFLALPFTAHSSDQFGLVQVPVADVRAASGTLPKSFEYDPLQETQLLYNEVVQIFEESGEWLKVEGFEQKEFTHQDAWQGYPGWVLKKSVLPSDKIIPPNLVIKTKTAVLRKRPAAKSTGMTLSMGTKLLSPRGKQKKGFWEIKPVAGGKAWIDKNEVRLLVAPSEEATRKMILESGMRLLGEPYFWGGMSYAAVDCSGFTHLAYRVAGIDIPRDSHEQFMMARKIKKEDLRPGDLIFSASKEKPDKVIHVAIFVDSTSILEAPKTGEVVRTIEFDKKYGPDAVLHFGTYFGQN